MTLRTVVSDRGPVRTRDGRTVMFSECGDPSGEVVFYLHGFPSSRLEGMLHAEAASHVGVRLIAVDRPGYGRSSPLQGAITHVARDVLDVADALQLTTFGVVGVSGGGAYAIACAALGADRVRRVALVAPLGPPDGPRFGMRPGTKRVLGAAARAPALFRRAQPVVGALVRRRAERMIERLALFDDIVPPGLGADLAARLGAELTLLPHEGHFSIVRNRMEEVLRWTIAQEPPDRSPE